MDKLTLAIETSIKTGSLALLQGDKVIDSWTGNNDVSRSEDLIPQINLLLEKNHFSLNQLQKIAVCVGPGSFTGMRVGIAVAKALALAIDCELTGVSILEAMASAANLPKNEKHIAVVPAGRDLYFWQSFHGVKTVADVEMGDMVSLENIAETGDISAILAEPAVYESLFRNNFRFLSQTEIVAGNYAELIGYWAATKTEKSDKYETVLPLYVRPPVVIKKS